MNNSRTALSKANLPDLATDYKKRSECDAEAGYFIFYSDRKLRLLNQCGLHFFQALEKEMASEAILFFAEAGEPKDIGEMLRSHRIDQLGLSIFKSFECILEKHRCEISPVEIATIERAAESFHRFVATELQSNWLHNNLRYPRLHQGAEGTITHWESIEFSEREIEKLKERLECFRSWAENLRKLVRSMSQ
jgi:hypothetical protein